MLLNRDNDRLTVARLLNSRWVYGFKDSVTITETFYFDSDGVVSGFVGEYEKNWMLEDGLLRIVDSTGTQTLPFRVVFDSNAQLLLVAEHPLDPSGSLQVYLREAGPRESSDTTETPVRQRGPLKDTSGRFRAAAITMVYNESYFLPIWLRHYGAHLGLDNLFVVDHGSDDGSITSDVKNRIRIPRDVFDDNVRRQMITNLHSALLYYFDVVIYTDCDELLVPRPSKYATMLDYLKQTRAATIRSVGINVMPHERGMPPLDLTKPLLLQRPYGFPTHWYFKPLVSAEPIRWVPGFHDAEEQSMFDPDLWLFHLKFANDQIIESYRSDNAENQPAELTYASGLKLRVSNQDLINLPLDRYFPDRLNGELGRIPDEFLHAVLPISGGEASAATARMESAEHQEKLGFIDVAARGGSAIQGSPSADRIYQVLVEPDPSEAERLNAASNGGADYTVVPTALGDVDGLVSLHVTINPTCTSILRPNHAFLAQYGIKREFQPSHTVTITSARYDTLFAKGGLPLPTIIKVDVQGFEYQVLQGFGTLLHACLALQIETHFYPIYIGQKLFGDMVEFLQPFDLTLRSIRNYRSPTLRGDYHFDGDLVEVDAYFTKSKKWLNDQSPSVVENFAIACTALDIDRY
jgi:FkbM family methyltransferase